MSSKEFAIGDKQDLQRAVRAMTSYDDKPSGLPSDQLGEIIDDAMREMYGRTGSDDWFDDLNYGMALKTFTQILAKAAVENIEIRSYSIADESVSLRNADPEDSQQIQLWMSQVNRALRDSDVDFPDQQDFGLRNTSGYIG